MTDCHLRPPGHSAGDGLWWRLPCGSVTRRPFDHSTAADCVKPPVAVPTHIRPVRLLILMLPLRGSGPRPERVGPEGCVESWRHTADTDLGLGLEARDSLCTPARQHESCPGRGRNRDLAREKRRDLCFQRLYAQPHTHSHTAQRQ